MCFSPGWLSLSSGPVEVKQVFKHALDGDGDSKGHARRKGRVTTLPASSPVPRVAGAGEAVMAVVIYESVGTGDMHCDSEVQRAAQELTCQSGR